MNSALKMTEQLNLSSPQTTQPLIALYCGSRSGTNPIYQEKAIALAKGIADQGFGLVYGGASIGLMGQVADAVVQNGGETVGVIPEFMLDYEIAHNSLTELYIVRTMHERKAMMAERSNAFVALPGGIGTFEELFEVWTWRQLGYHDKPLGLLNVAGYYDGLLGFLQSSVANGFMGNWQMDLLHASTDVEALLRTLVQEAGPDQASMPLRSVI